MRGISQAQQAHLPVGQRHVHQEAAAQVPPDAAVVLQRPSRRFGRDARPCRRCKGVFKAAIEGIVAAKQAGFLVCTNTTVYKETNIGEIDRLFSYLTRLGVDGFLLSPAYGYEAVHCTNPDDAAEIFLTRDEVRAKFKEAMAVLGKYRLMSSPVYLDFLAGKGRAVLYCLG